VVIQPQITEFNPTLDK